MSQQQDDHNYFELTAEFVQHTSQHIFLTGKAGTGKTTFLKHIKENGGKQMAVIAPTGVAAINAGGVTMHSFFQLPLGCFIPGSLNRQMLSQNPVTDRYHLLRNLRMSNEKTELIRNLELLIIDEVSMLRCDWLDAIDIILKHVRKNRESFGGVQMLYIGDLYQLPPVAKDNEWSLLKEHYVSPFFFEAQALKHSALLCIELKKIYRQSDEEFIHLLNRVRNNEMSEDDFHRLQKLYQPHFKPKPEDHYITLTTHNYKADEINARELKRLPGKEFVSEATTNGDFPDRIFPAEGRLVLKEGAQVMFIKNDVKEKKYFNGKIGVIAEIDHDGDEDIVRVRFPESKETITLEKETWRNIRYSFNESENRINEEELGAFTQYPIRLAWAVTIHKSQGLTFQKAVIDAGSAFAAGQVYVALSRCVSLDGIVLLSAIRSDAIKTDESILSFMSQQINIDQMQVILAKEKELYIIKTSLELFNLQPAVDRLEGFIAHMLERQLKEKEKIILGLHSVNDSILKLKVVAEKFQQQVRQFTSGGLTDSIQSLLSERITKAKIYFEKELDEKVNDPLLKINKELQQMNKVKKVLKDMKTFMNFFEHFTLRFQTNPKKREEKMNHFLPAHHANNELTDENSQHLLTILKKIRTQFAIEENAAPFMVCHDSTLKEMAAYLPQSYNDLAVIKGMGDRALSKYGDAFLVAIQSFSKIHGLSGRMDLKEEELRQKKSKKKSKSEGDSDSKTQSFQLFQSGKTIPEIAAQRSFSTGTIESHLAHFVRTGALDVFQLLTKEKFEMIKEALQKTKEPGLTAVKILLGDDVTYSEIRFVIAAQQRNGNEDVSAGID